MCIHRLFVILIVFFVCSSSLMAEAPGAEIWTARKAISYARQNNPDSQIALQRMLEADAMVQKAGAGFFPQVELFGAYSQTNNPMYSFGNILNHGEFTRGMDFNAPGRTDNLALGVGVNYRFYNGGQDIANRKAAEAGAELSAAAREAVLLQLEFEVFQSFQKIIEAGNVIQARQKALEAIESSLAVARSRFEAGDLFRHDLLNLEVEQLKATENLVEAQHDLEMAERIFLTLMGLPGDDLDVVTEADEGPALPGDFDPVRRPELKTLTAALQAAESRLAAARGSRLPTLDGFARYSYDQGTILGGQGDSWQAGVNLNFKVFDGHQAAAEIALIKARVDALRVERKKLKLALGLEVNRARLALELALERQQVVQKIVEQAVESERLSKARFDAGVLMVSELIDSESRLTDARLRDVLASTAVKIAKADLRRAVGLPQFTADVYQLNSVENQP